MMARSTNNLKTSECSKYEKWNGPSELIKFKLLETGTPASTERLK